MVRAALRALVVLFPISNFLFPVYAAQPVSVVDDRGKTLTIARPAGRIVALAPSLAELVFAAGAGSSLAGTVRYSNHPPAARDIEIVGDALRVDFERIVALNPDLVLAWRSGNSAADMERLERLGYPVHVSEPRRLADIARQLRVLGALAGTAAAAGRAAADFERSIGELRRRHAAARRVRVFYEVWRKPLMTVNGAHLISDVLALCGGENVFGDVPQLAPAVTLEAFIAARPEVILGGTRPGGDDAYAREWRAQALAPMRGLPVFYIDPDLMQRPTPRIVDGAKAVCAALEQVRANRKDS
jgi:iron complex transport system substrate-binding protein